MDPWLVEHKPELYMAMIDTADVVAKRYGISAKTRTRSRCKASSARRGPGRRPVRQRNHRLRHTHDGEEQGHRRSHLPRRGGHQDNCNRASTTLEGLAKLEPVKGPGNFITAGNASQLSDGSSACVLMEARLAERLGLQPLGAFRGFAVAGCEPDEMGIGPVFAVPKLLSATA
jgi:acetyl-CoA C-acetyltransferase